MDGKSVVKRINALLKEKKIPKETFYKDCKISSGGFSQWKTERTFPTQKNLKIIADYLETTPEYLLTGENAQKEAPGESQEPLDEVTQELREIWDDADEDERRALLEMARLIKKRRGS